MNDDSYLYEKPHIRKNSKSISKSHTFPNISNMGEHYEYLYLNKTHNAIRAKSHEKFKSCTPQISIENFTYAEIYEKLFENINSLRKENQQLKIDHNIIIQEKEEKISELSDKLKNIERKGKKDNIASIENMDGILMEVLMKDVGEEQNKLNNRINLLKAELESQSKENEENIRMLERKLQQEKEDKIKSELDILYHSQQKIMAQSIEFVEINEEKLNYYQNLCVNLKEQLENIERSHLKEISILKELCNSQIKQSNDYLKNFYENKIKSLGNENKMTLQKQNAYINELEDMVKSLLNKISILETEKQKIINDKDKLNKELLKLFSQNQNYQNTIEELIPMHESHIQKLQERFQEEKKSLTFELKTLKKNKHIPEIFETQKGHKKHFSHDIKEITEWNNHNNPNLAFELSNAFDKTDDKKSSFYFKNSIVESVRTSSHSSAKKEVENKKESLNHNPSQLNSIKKSMVITKTSILRESKAHSIQMPIPIASINFISQIKGTIIRDSASIGSNYLYKIDNLELENFNEAFYIQQNERTIEKIAKDIQVKDLTETSHTKDNKVINNLKRFIMNLYNEHMLIMKELLKKTLDKFDSYCLKTLLFFDLISITILGYEEAKDGHIEYNIELFDKLLNKSWHFNSRYSKLRRLHLETKFSLALDCKSIKLAEFPGRKLFGNKNKSLLEHRRKKLQAYFDNYLKNKDSNVIIEKGILRYYFYREVWAEIEKNNSNRLKEISKEFDHSQMILKINDVFEEIKSNLSLLNRNEALVFIYYQNKLKTLNYQESSQILN